jgi:methyl-accepting chemotaxis protein
MPLRELELETTASAAMLKARLAQINDAMEEQRDHGKALDGKLKDATDQARTIEQKLGQIVGTTNSVTKNSSDIAVLRQSVEEVVKLSEVVAQLQKRVADLAGASAAPPQVQMAQAAQIAQSLTNASLQLGQATVFVQFKPNFAPFLTYLSD